MKNNNSKINPFLGAGILGAATPVAVYFIGFLTMLLWALAALILLPFLLSKMIDEVVFLNVMSIGGLALQVLSIVILTLVLSAFANLKIYHLLISAAVSSLLFFITERFLTWIWYANFPWKAGIFPKLSKLFIQQFNSEFVEQRMYFITTLMLTVTFFAISLITWGIYRAASRNKQRGDEL